MLFQAPTTVCFFFKRKGINAMQLTVVVLGGFFFFSGMHLSVNSPLLLASRQLASLHLKTSKFSTPTLFTTQLESERP